MLIIIVLYLVQVSIANCSIELSKENLMRLGRVLLPPDAEVLSSYCKQVNDVIIMFDDDSAGNYDADRHYCHRQGFDDTLRFLQKRYMISCTRCLAVASTYEIEDEMDEEEWEVIVTDHLDHNDGHVGVNQVQSGGCKEYDPNCLECKLQRHIASQSTVPENVWEVTSIILIMIINHDLITMLMIRMVEN